MTVGKEMRKISDGQFLPSQPPISVSKKLQWNQLISPNVVKHEMENVGFYHHMEARCMARQPSYEYAAFNMVRKVSEQYPQMKGVRYDYGTYH